jgi:hypothetical protein
MSTGLVDISYDLINGIYTILNTHVTYGGITYPVYKSIPKTPASIYVFIGNVIQMEDGTKDEFMYNGSVQIHIVDESQERADLKLSQTILNVVRGLLKPARATTFTVGSRTLIVLTPESLSTVVQQADNGISKIRLVDMYNFMIQ